MKKLTKHLKRGDVILALDGHEIPNAEIRRITVTKFVEITDDGTVVVEVGQRTNVISPRRYLRAKTVSYGRLVTLAGHRMLKTDEERYVTLDGHYEVYADNGHTTWCDHEHPVRITDRDRAAFRATVAEYGRHRALLLWGDTGRAIEDGRKGYLCPGGAEHNYTQWIAWDPKNDRDLDTYWTDNATDAAAQLPEGA